MKTGFFCHRLLGQMIAIIFSLHAKFVISMGRSVRKKSNIACKAPWVHDLEQVTFNLSNRLVDTKNTNGQSTDKRSKRVIIIVMCGLRLSAKDEKIGFFGFISPLSALFSFSNTKRNNYNWSPSPVYFPQKRTEVPTQGTTFPFNSSNKALEMCWMISSTYDKINPTCGK